MSNQVDHFDRRDEPADRYHPQYDSFRDWLDAEAPARADKPRNQQRYAAGRNTLTLAALVKR